MSRKSIFLLAAAVVLLYFSVILFMLSPFQGTRNTYYGGSYMNHMFIRQIPTVNWCKEQQYRSPPSKNVVALVSFPGSGNTWLRYLLQQVTGIVTGSIYMDNGLRVHGFPAESVTDGSVLVVKTHQYPSEEEKFHSAVLLIRNPKDAILADFNRMHKGHIGTAPKSAFLKKLQDKKPGEDWASHVSSQLSYWERLHEAWLTQYSGHVHVVFYETLVHRTRATLHEILRFLNYNVTEADMDCAMKNKEGIYRRRKKLQDFDPYTEEMYSSIHKARSRVLGIVADYRTRLRSEQAAVITMKQEDYR